MSGHIAYMRDWTALKHSSCPARVNPSTLETTAIARDAGKDEALEL